MVKRVHGYKADDGQFFDTSEEAELHEATVILTNLLTEQFRVNPVPFINVIENNPEEVIRVCKAVKVRNEQDVRRIQAATATIAYEGNGVVTRPSQRPVDHTRGEAFIQTVVKQPPR
jgi:hypothetical protein